LGRPEWSKQCFSVTSLGRYLYQLNGQEYKTINWTGNIKQYNYEVIEDIEGVADGQGGDWSFYIKSVNGVIDEEHENDTIKHYISPAAPISSNEIVISWKTHSAPKYVYWDIIDDEGNYLIRIGDTLLIYEDNIVFTNTYNPGTVYDFPIDISSYGETCLTLRTFTAGGTSPGQYLNVVQGTDTLASIKEWAGSDRYAARNLYTTFVSTEDAKSGTRMLLFPNPANESVMIVFESEQSEEVEIGCFNALGQVMKFEMHNSLSGENTILLETSTLPVGVYYLTLLGSKSFGSAKLVIQK
jgi:Secretion system C-terminal sorting domain